MSSATAPAERPALFARIGIAIVAFFRCIGNADFAAGVRRVAVDVGGDAAGLRALPADAALQLLALLQAEGRLVDFLEESVDGFTDADIGAAARVVHQGCRKVLHEYVTLAPVRSDNEGAPLLLPPGFDAREVRLVGNVTGRPPFRGVLRHRGWRVTDVRLPRLAAGHDPRVLAPAEVEL